MGQDASRTWPKDIFEALRALEVRQVAYVPDAGHTELIERCAAAPAMVSVLLTSEEEGVALLAGAWLGGQRGALLMQSSGVGNCVNLFSLIRVCRFPLLMLITLRGQEGEFNPWQRPMGQITDSVLRLAGSRVFPLDDPGAAGSTVAAAGRGAFAESSAAAVLISQNLVGIKTFVQ